MQCIIAHWSPNALIIRTNIPLHFFRIALPAISIYSFLSGNENMINDAVNITWENEFQIHVCSLPVTRPNL